MRNGKSWLEDAFQRLHCQSDATAPASRLQDDSSRLDIKAEDNVDATGHIEEKNNFESQLRTPRGDTIDDDDVHRLFLGRCPNAEALYKVFILLSSPDADDTSWVRVPFQHECSN